MAIDAIVANMDHVWLAFNDAQDDDNSERQSDDLKRLLQRIRNDGYPLLLMSDLSAENLYSAINAALGQDGVTWFSAILASRSHTDRFAVAVRTLETSPHRVMALGGSEHELEEARTFGIAHCVHFTEALRHASP
jgi:phosphoglycolate phosphatase-like HAD superfamily hydrolase